MNDYQAVNSALNSAGIDLSADFHSLDSFKVGILVDLAKQQKYRKPRRVDLTSMGRIGVWRWQRLCLVVH